MLRISLVLGCCLLVGVMADHHEGFDEETQDLEDLVLLQKMDQLDQMIKLVRNARSVHEDNEGEEDEESIVDDKEMIAVMERVDLDNPENVELVADVMRTLPGDVQLEFLMKKFMMSAEESVFEKSQDHQHDNQHVHDHVKRSVLGGFGHFGGSQVFTGYAEPEPEYISTSRFTSHSHAEPEPGFHQRWRRASEHSQAKEQGHHEHQEHSKEHAKASHQAKEQRQESSSHSAHAKHGKFFRSGNSAEFEGQGPAGVLLQRSAEKHGFQEKLNQRDSSHHKTEESSKQGSIIEKLKETIAKQRRRRSSEDGEPLPKKQPVAYLDL